MAPGTLKGLRSVADYKQNYPGDGQARQYLLHNQKELLCNQI